MATQRRLEPHPFVAYADASEICRHCDGGRYARQHDEQCADDCHFSDHDEQPASATGRETEQSQLFSRYTFAVVTGRYKILDNRSDGPVGMTQIATADGEEEARTIVRALNDHEQNERLREVLRQVRGRHQHRAKAANFNDCGCNDCAILELALNHAEEREES